MKSRTSNESEVRRRIRGQGLTEYIIILALIAVASILAVGAFGGVVKDSFSAMAQRLQGSEPTAVQVAPPAVGATEGTLGKFK